MTDSKSIFENAAVRFAGVVLGANDRPIEMFVVETIDGLFWFEAKTDYLENGNDFRTTIRNFGLHRKFAAGSTTPLARRSFSAVDSQAAKARVELFFLGSNDKTSLPYSPFPGAKGRCMGVKFPDGWATITPDGGASR
jgi:hypothetical protein